MKKKIISAILMIALAFTLACPSVFAANRTVTITGTVYGANGTVIPNVPVKIVDNANPSTAISSTTSNYNGNIYFSANLTDGSTYTITATFNTVDYTTSFVASSTTVSVSFYPAFGYNGYPGYPGGTNPGYPGYPGYPNNGTYPGLGNIVSGSYDGYGNFNFSYYDGAGILRYGYVDKNGKIYYDAYYNRNFNVTFETNGGTSISTKTYNQGDTLVEPTAPTKSGYVFGGWYTDSALTSMLEPNTRVESNMVLYARWLTEAPTTPAPTPKPVAPTPDPGLTEVPQTNDSSAPIIPVLLAAVLAGGFLFSRRKENNN